MTGDDPSLKNKVAIVTGATGSLGRVVVKSLLERAASVVVPYRDEKRFLELADFVGSLKDGLTGIVADITLEPTVRRLVEETLRRHGRIDILLNIAGGYRGGAEISATPETDWDFLMDLNLKSAFLCSKAVLPSMVNQNFGRIVNVSARPAVENKGRVKSGAYAVSKAGVAVLTETIAEEFKKLNITANSIVPGTIDTPENRLGFPFADFSKWVKPEQIASVVLFLISDAAGITSGALIPVYGKS
jgi:NAD(P)-dependent dehydrogenase (short-subunit alcohol dehydrogenase family)